MRERKDRGNTTSSNFHFGVVSTNLLGFSFSDFSIKVIMRIKWEKKQGLLPVLVIEYVLRIHALRIDYANGFLCHWGHHWNLSRFRTLHFYHCVSRTL